MLRHFRLLAAIVASIAATGCGIKGPLVLPPAKPPAATTNPATTPPSATTPETAAPERKP